MIISKHYIENILEETLAEYSDKIFPLKKGIVKIEYIDKKSFMDSVKEDPMIQQQITYGLYKNIDKEYPNFMVVYKWNKSPLSVIMNNCYKVSFCFEIAREKLKPFKSLYVKEYLKRAFAHEITHIVEDTLITKMTDIWKQCIEETKIGSYAKEMFAENIADMIGDKQKYKYVEDILWEKVYKNINKQYKQRN